MQHFVAYHNTEKMGYTLPSGQPQRLLTNKLVRHLLQSTIWLITYEGIAHPRRYCLGSVFRVDQVGDSHESGFTRFASGPGHVFQPPVPIKHLSWFANVLWITGNFRRGVQPIKDLKVIAGLTEIARQAGYKVI